MDFSGRLIPYTKEWKPGTVTPLSLYFVLTLIHFELDSAQNQSFSPSLVAWYLLPTNGCTSPTHFSLGTRCAVFCLRCPWVPWIVFYFILRTIPKVISAPKLRCADVLFCCEFGGRGVVKEGPAKMKVKFRGMSWIDHETPLNESGASCLRTPVYRSFSWLLMTAFPGFEVRKSDQHCVNEGAP